MDTEFLSGFIGLAAMIVAAAVAWIIGCVIDKHIATPILRRMGK